MKRMCFAAIAAVTLMGSTAVMAEGPFEKEIKARKALMQVYAFNMGLLGSMAKGEREYDADLATAAANNLNAAVMMKNPTMWPEGSGADNADLTVETRAKGEIWSTYPEIAKRGEAMAEASAALAEAAGTGLDAMKEKLGPTGKGCKGCHDDFRVPKKK